MWPEPEKKIFMGAPSTGKAKQPRRNILRAQINRNQGADVELQKLTVDKLRNEELQQKLHRSDGLKPSMRNRRVNADLDLESVSKQPIGDQTIAEARSEHSSGSAKGTPRDMSYQNKSSTSKDKYKKMAQKPSRMQNRKIPNADLPGMQKA